MYVSSLLKLNSYVGLLVLSELKAPSTIGCLCFSIQVWAQELPTGQECRVLVTVQGSRGQVRDTPTHTKHTNGTQTRSSSCSLPLFSLYLYLQGGSDSLLDKIQKAAEVVASAVLPPTEHQGIRLHDNHYRAVVAPSAPIEVAVPACAYNLPARRPKGGILMVLILIIMEAYVSKWKV